MSAVYASPLPLLGEVADLIEPPPSRSADEWADACRVLPPESPEPGQWRSSRVPYTRAICRDFDDPGVDTVVVVMGSQMAKTETILNLLGHRFCDGPVLPAMYVGPTQKQVSSMSADRFQKMIDSTPKLRDRVAGGHADKIAEKIIAGVRLGFAWAGSATELASHPAALVLVDERDRMASDVGNEGDPVEIVRARGDAYAAQKIGIFSTPTVRGASPVWSLFESGTMHKWAWPCDHCGVVFVPCLAYLKWPSDADFATIRARAAVHCPHCGGEHLDARRPVLNAAGQYVPHVLDDKGDHVAVDVAPPNRTRSRLVSGLASPFVSFGESAERLARAYRSKETAKIQAVINTRFGEPFELRGDAPRWESLRQLVRPVPPGLVPEWASLLTMGTDVQREGLYYVVRAWGYDRVIQSERSALLEAGHLHGSTDFDDVWLAWLAILNAAYPRQLDHERKSGAPLHIKLALVDSGFNPARDRFKRPEHRVYDWCRRTGWRAQPSKGHDEQREPVSMSKLDRLPSGQALKGGLKLWHVDTDHFKTWLHAEVRRALEQDDPTWALHAETTEDYMRQVVAEELIVKPSGRRIWTVPKSRANHYLDCEVLARAAAYIHRGRLLASFQAPATASAPADEPAPAVPPAARPENSYFRVGQGSYFRR